MATNRPQGDLVGWRVNKKHFQLQKKKVKFLPWMKNPILLMLAVGFKPTTRNICYILTFSRDSLFGSIMNCIQVHML